MGNFEWYNELKVAYDEKAAAAATDTEMVPCLGGIHAINNVINNHNNNNLITNK